MQISSDGCLLPPHPPLYAAQDIFNFLTCIVCMHWCSVIFPCPGHILMVPFCLFYCPACMSYMFNINIFFMDVCATSIFLLLFCNAYPQQLTSFRCLIVWLLKRVELSKCIRMTLLNEHQWHGLALAVKESTLGCSPTTSL